MSQIVTRKGPFKEDKDKRQTQSPVKEMKKKMAANAEKEKQAAEKNVDKGAEKQANKSAEKNIDKNVDKSFDKKDKHIDKKDKSDKDVENKLEKNTEKKEKPTTSEKTTDKKDKSADKKETTEKPKEVSSTEEKCGKSEKEDEKSKKTETPKQNGDATSKAHNGEDVTNGTVSESDDDELMIVEQENDEIFPELTYDDNSDAEGFEFPDAPSRSLTRRSQVKVTRTPETPRPASEKQADKETDDSKEPKVLKLKEDIPITDRRLRSAGSPKPPEKKLEKLTEKEEMTKTQDKEEKSQEKPQEMQEKAEGVQDIPKNLQDVETAEENKQEKANSQKLEVEVVIEVETAEDGEARKPDTNYSKSRVKVSPYRRSLRLADNTASSMVANYTGNNTTLEMDITDVSFASEEPSMEDNSYLSGLRNIRGRRSYKPLKEMALRNISVSRSQRSTTTNLITDVPPRPTGAVVGRKRKPEGFGADEAVEGEGKRARLLDLFARPFYTHSTPRPARRAADIVGINTDLPLTAPVASPEETFDPETLKTVPSTSNVTPLAPTAAPHHSDKESKRCIVM